MRTLAGIGIGAISSIAPAYTAELASDKSRGVILGLFQVSILQNAGVRNRTLLLLLTFAIGFWNLITSIPQLFFIEKRGRKPVLLVGSIILAIGMFILMLSTLIHQLAKDDKQFYLAIPGIVIFLAGFEIGIGPVFFVMIAEMFPEKVSNIISCLLMTLMWISNLIVVTVYSPLSKAIGDKGVFIITFVFSSILVVFTIFVVKETKGMHSKQNLQIEQEKNHDINNVV
ncbi:MAG: hypothetical protein EZS28_009795 [Streblomastix strix]|uniref:Major facilitator superfamily (MFS) profile domain-containing protein n=1 Tax=Streblomastix strix TaxID=222440 RepID=A0A5J4WIM2_9EUKA|nr:MAG: hypothetical protein EZS28_009795 [Streblomastix strix]